jgi:hypothetical protein
VVKEKYLEDETSVVIDHAGFAYKMEQKQD